MAKNFLDAVKDRRTYYGISSESTITDEKTGEIIQHAILHTPSAFNSQSSRVILLLGNEHIKLWETIREVLRGMVPAESFEATSEKIQSFQNGHGTVLFFEDQKTVEGLQNHFPLYKDNFPIWSQQSAGMLQLVVWTALEEEGLGASLQHYSELIKDKVMEYWNADPNWKLIAQMPFGKPVQAPGEKEFMDVKERFTTYGG